MTDKVWLFNCKHYIYNDSSNIGISVQFENYIDESRYLQLAKKNEFQTITDEEKKEFMTLNSQSLAMYKRWDAAEKIAEN